MDKQRVVVLGNGMVGHQFIEYLLEADREGRYAILTFSDEPRLAYLVDDSLRDGRGEWVEVCLESDLVRDSGVCVLLAGEQVALFRDTLDGAVYAIANHDPFSRANVLSRGIIGSLGGRVVVASPLYKQLLPEQRPVPGRRGRSPPRLAGQGGGWASLPALLICASRAPVLYWPFPDKPEPPEAL